MKGKRAPPEVKYDDGDQSPMEGSFQNWMASLQAMHSMDYIPTMPHMSDWMKKICNGDFDGMMAILASKSAESIQKILNRRESMKSRGALFHVINGAGAAYTGNVHVDVKVYLKILKKLLSLGAEVNVRDAHGWSPLLFCIWISSGVEANCSGVFLKIAKILIQAGASVNSKDRCGSTALIVVTVMKKLDWIRFLMDEGANPFIVDNENASPFSIVSGSYELKGVCEAGDSKELELFAQYTTAACKEERLQLHRAAGGSLKKCSVCSSRPRRVAKKCTGCFMVYYCSKGCQVQDWDNHKNFCKVSNPPSIHLFASLFIAHC